MIIRVLKWLLLAVLEQAREYLAMLREPGALTGTLNWYRANLSGDTPPVPDTVEVYTPTLFIWGNRDEAVGQYSVQQQASYMKGPYREIELDAGHWLLSEKRERTVGVPALGTAQSAT